MVQGDVPDDKPDWWVRSEQLKEELGLPEYEPSRFRDGTYTYQVISELEDKHECIIRFASKNPKYPDDWQVRVDNDPAFPIGRFRDDNGNTVYKMVHDEFRRLVEREVMDG